MGTFTKTPSTAVLVLIFLGLLTCSHHLAKLYCLSLVEVRYLQRVQLLILKYCLAILTYYQIKHASCPTQNALFTPGRLVDLLALSNELIWWLNSLCRIKSINCDFTAQHKGKILCNGLIWPPYV